MAPEDRSRPASGGRAEGPVAPKRTAPSQDQAKGPSQGAKPAQARREAGAGQGALAFLRRRGPGAVRGLGMLFAVGSSLVIAAAAFAGLYLNNLAQDLPDYEVLADYQPPVTTRVYATNGALVAEFARERRLFMPIETIPDQVKKAFISAEDQSFYEHDGLDMKGIVRAQISNVGNIINGRRLEGGSTISQQVAKVFLLSSEQKLDRKLKEWLVTRRIERAFTKDQILELYLNEIYLGNRSYGVAAAALNYFDKSSRRTRHSRSGLSRRYPQGPQQLPSGALS